MAKIDTQKKDYIYYNLTDEKKLKDYLISEREELIYLKDILTGNKKIPENELQDFLSKTISDKEYLFLHFPDGHQFQYNQSFLNRVRVEIDYFLGIIK